MKRPSLYIGKKNIVTFVLASAILLYGIISSIDGVRYFFSDDAPTDLKRAMSLDKKPSQRLRTATMFRLKGSLLSRADLLRKACGVTNLSFST